MITRILAYAWIVALAALLTSGVVFAEPFKLYINKHNSDQNFVLLENQLSATVTHTAEGMEIILDGVEVSLRCRGDAASTDACTIAIEPDSSSSGGSSTGGSSTGSSSGGSSTGSSSGGSSTGSSSGSDDCTPSSWNSCDGTGSSSSGGSSGGSTSGSSTGGSSTSGSSSGVTTVSTGGCGGIVACSSKDFGANGTEPQATYTIRPSKIYAFPMSAPNRTASGSVTWATTASTPANTDNSMLRVWFSKEAGGVPVSSDDDCGDAVSSIGTAGYYYGGSYPGYCTLNSGTNYYINFAYCPGNSDSDLRCLNSPAAAQSLNIYLKP